MPRYTVTAAAGPQVAGRRAEPEDVIEISAHAAAYELLCGALEPATGASHPPRRRPRRAAEAPPEAAPEAALEPPVKDD